MSSNVFLTKWSEISGQRFDPLYYSGEVSGFFKKIKYPLKNLNSVIIQINSGVGAGKDDQADYENGVLHLRPTNIDKYGYLKLDRNIYIPQNMNYSKVEVGDVVFNNTNSQELVGKTLYIDNKIDAYYSNHMTNIKVNSEIEAKYLWVIFNLYQQNRIFYNICTNWNNQSGVGLELLKSLKIPIPPKQIQEEIINKIQNAYEQKQQKENEAKKLLDSIDEYLLKELGIDLPKIDETDISKRVFLRKWSEISGDRFDPDYYSPKYFEKNNTLKKASCRIVTLKDIAIIFQGVGKSETDNPQYTLLKVKNILKDSTIDFEDVEFVSSVPKNKLLSKGDIISPFIGEAIKQFKFALFDAEEDKYTVDNNTGVIRINSKKINNCYVSEVLNSGFVRWQIEQLIGGGGVPFIGSNGAKLIKIPRPRIKQQNKIANHIENIREQAKSLKQQAIDDFEKAKKEVEAMLLGESDEI